MWSDLPLKIRGDEVVETRLGPIRATQVDVSWLRQIRAFLLEKDAKGWHVDAAEVHERVGLPHDFDDLARLLALIEVDCSRRGEPSLARLVAGVPGPVDFSDDEGTLVMSQDEVNRVLDEFYGRIVYRDDPDQGQQ